MNIIEQISKQMQTVIGIESEYIKLIILSIIVLVISSIIKLIIRKIYAKAQVSDRKKFMHNRKLQIGITTISILIILLIWSEKLQGIITLVSFISAGIAIAIREIIFNFFAGIYIRFTKPFELEDRIEIDNLKGDVINIHALGFEILEVGERVNGEQSSGRIAHIPNSLIFQKPLKNYVKAFKYIWHEMTLNIEIDSNIEKTKEILYEIVNNNKTLKTIPKKMETEVDDSILEYRIYYNNLEPIIYTRIIQKHIEVYIRFLVHPKKARNVEDEIYEKIVEEYQKGNIKLYEKK